MKGIATYLCRQCHAKTWIIKKNKFGHIWMLCSNCGCMEEGINLIWDCPEDPEN